MATSLRRKYVIFLLVLLPLSILTVLIYLGYECNYPRDEVRVTVTGIPQDVSFACLVAESQGRLQGMKLYRRHIFGPFVLSHLQSLNREDAGDFKDRVAWMFGERYGVITCNTDKTWHITWFHASEVPWEGRSVLLGGGSVLLDLSKGRTEQLPRDEVEALDLECLDR